MSKKFGLGKGLNALIPEDTTLGTLDTKVEKTKNIKEKSSILIDINLIKSNEGQPRKSFDDEKILLNTKLGFLTIKGSELKMNKLDVQNGDVIIIGNISSIVYSSKEVKKEKENIISKLFK